MTIVKYKVVASRPNPLGTPGVPELRKESMSNWIAMLAAGEDRTQLANNPRVTGLLARELRSTSSVTAKHARSAIRTLMSPNFNGIQLKNNPDMIRELSTSLGQAEDDSVTTVVSAIETLAMSDANSRELAKQSELVEYLCAAMEDEAKRNAQSAAWLLAQLTKLEANRDVLTRHEEVIPGLVKALSSETTIWPAALALDHLNQLGVLKDKPAVVLYLLSNESVLNGELTAHMYRFISSDFSDNLANHVTTCRPQLRKNLLSTRRGPIYTKAFKTALETYLGSLTVSVNPKSSAAEIMNFAEAVIPKSMVSLYAFEREKGVYFLRSIRGLHMMLSAMPDTMFSEMPDSDRKTTLMERLWPTPKPIKMKMEEMEKEIAQHTADPKILEYVTEVPIQYLNPTDYELETRSLSEPALGKIYKDRGKNSALL